MRERRTSGDFVLERRRTPRIPMRVEVECSIGGACFEGITENLTVHGFFLRTEISAPLHTAIELTLFLPDESEPAKAGGHIIRLARRKDDVPGFAVEFDNLDDDLFRRISSLVEEERTNLILRTSTQ